MRLRNPLHGFKFAVEGVVHVFRTQRHMKFHFLTLVAVLVVSLLWGLNRAEVMVLMFTISLVLVAEMFNTAIEAVVDLVTQTYHPLAKFAKDIAAGAVLVTTLNAVVVGFLLFIGGGTAEQRQAWWHPFERVEASKPDAVIVTVVGVALLMVFIVMWKVSGGKGKMWHGGVVSGHTTIGFFLAVSAFLLSGRVTVGILAFLMALIIAQSRVEARIHTVKEVAAGAVLGTGVTFLVYYLAGSLPWTR